MKRYFIKNITIVSACLIAVLLGILLNSILIPAIIILLSMAIIVSLFVYERYKFGQRLVLIILNKKYDKAIKYIKIRLENTYLMYTYRKKLVKLAEMYMIIGDTNSINELILNNKYLQKTKHMYYFRFLLNLSEGKLATAKISNKKINTLNDQDFYSVKVITNEIIENIDNNYYNDRLSILIEYPISKDIYEVFVNRSINKINEGNYNLIKLILLVIVNL